MTRINSRTHEGRLALALLAVVTTTSHQSKTPDDVIASVHPLISRMFQGEPEPTDGRADAEVLKRAKKALLVTLREESTQASVEYAELVLREIDAALKGATGTTKGIRADMAALSTVELARELSGRPGVEILKVMPSGSHEVMYVSTLYREPCKPITVLVVPAE